jgi:hypothetical protein
MKHDDKLGPYQLVSPGGEGGMGDMWKARGPRPAWFDHHLQQRQNGVLS